MTLSELFRLWHLEINGSESNFQWLKLIRRVRSSKEKSIVFWYRTSQYFFGCDSRLCKSLAKRISKRNSRRYGVEIMPGATFGPGLNIGHAIGIVIHSSVVAGRNLTIRQNTTIGTINDRATVIQIGDNVDIGAHSCILGEKIHIGNNVKIGAMSFVNEDIPDNVTFVSVKTGRIIPHASCDQTANNL